MSLAVDDLQPTRQIYDADTPDDQGKVVKNLVGEPVVFRPALDTPLRPAFAEAMAAMLQQRLFDSHRINFEGARLPGDGMTGGMCLDQYDRLRMRSERFSIHDPADKP